MREGHNMINMDPIVKSQFLSLYCMVLADGIIDALEMEKLYKIGTEQYGLSQADITAAVRDAGSSFIFPNSFRDKIQLLMNLAEIALADNDIDPAEKALMRKYIIKMGFLEANAEQISEFIFDSVQKKLTLEQVLTFISNN